MANPFIAAADTGAASAAAELPYLQEYAWDFGKNRFVYDNNGKNIIVTENEAIKIWVYKCLKCERFLYNAFCHGLYNDRCNYGVFLEKYIGANPNTEATASIIQEEIKDAIAANPYIKNINYCDITEIAHEKLTIARGLTSIYGNLELQLNI